MWQRASTVLLGSSVALSAGAAYYLNRKVQTPCLSLSQQIPPETSQDLKEDTRVIEITSATPEAHPAVKYTAPFSDFSSCRYGYPSFHNVIQREGFVLDYDTRTRNALWVCQLLTGDSMGNQQNVTREGSNFREDDCIPPLFRAKLSDYRDSGYDRGHLTPAADHKKRQESMDETFFLSNISPQVGVGFNRHYWARFETFVRNLLIDWEEVNVCTGPLWIPVQKQVRGKSVWVVENEVIGNPPLVHVPTHFYKVILASGNKTDPNAPFRALAAFVMPNSSIPTDTPLTSFQVSKEYVEMLSGVTFFPNVLPTPMYDEEFKEVTQTPPGSTKLENSSSTAVTTTQPPQTQLMAYPSEAWRVELGGIRTVDIVRDLCSVSSCTLPPPDVWTVSNERKDELRATLENFLNSDHQKLNMPTTLSGGERKLVHQLSDKLGLEHYSVGPPAKRQIVIEKKPVVEAVQVAVIIQTTPQQEQ